MLTVAVEVATTCPEALVDNRELIAVEFNESVPNVFVPVNVLFVYVFGIVVEEWMYELVVLFRNVVSRVRTLDELVNPEPRSDLNV